MTYGQIRMRLAQLVPGISLDLWDGWLRDRYISILDALRWKRRKAEASLTTEAGVSVYTLPEDCRVLENLIGPEGALAERSETELAQYPPETIGIPFFYRWTFDDDSAPPRLQVRLFPAPDREVTLAVHYIAEDTTFTTAAVSLLPWVRESCLVAGAQADGLAHKALLEIERASVYLALSERALREHGRYLADMKATAVANTKQLALRLADKYQTKRFFR